ncbi:hypothetical protein D3C80_1243860 [compost metagenome]
MLNANRCQIFRQNVFGKVRLTLIEIARHQIHRQQAAPFQVHQQRQQAVAVLAAGKANQPALLAFQHVKVFKGLAHIAQQPLAQLVEGHRPWRMCKQCVRGDFLCTILNVIDGIHVCRNIHGTIALSLIRALIRAVLQPMPVYSGNIKPRIPTSLFGWSAFPAQQSQARSYRPC